MTICANPEQSENWNGDHGHRWVARADERDHVLEPVADALFTTAGLTPGEHVLDVGCGCGATTLRAAALVGSVGSSMGIDLSNPMLELARRRADNLGARGTEFVQGDAQTHGFAAGSADVAVSRFGTMFFSDPVAAFTNIATALSPGGRLVLATWQPLEANDWLIVPGAALLAHTTIPEQPPGPGMFAQSDPDCVTTVLDAAGFRDIHLEAANVTFNVGATVDAALEYLADSGPGRLLVDSIPEGAAREAAFADVRVALGPHHHESGIQLGGGIWLITARRP